MWGHSTLQHTPTYRRKHSLTEVSLWSLKEVTASSNVQTPLQTIRIMKNQENSIPPIYCTHPSSWGDVRWKCLRHGWHVIRVSSASRLCVIESNWNHKMGNHGWGRTAVYLLFINCAKISIPFCLKEKDVEQYDKNKLCIILILSGFSHLSLTLGVLIFNWSYL